MAKSQMVNFRAPTESVDMYDEAANASGMTRSQWLRNAAEVALASFRDRGFTQVAVEITPKEGASCPSGNFRTCDISDWAKLPTGIHVCRTCGVRKA